MNRRTFLLEISDVFKMNRTLLLLMISDIFIFSGWGLITPILAIFIKDNLIGGSIAAAGLASAIFLITHATLQIVFAKVFNPKDRFWMIMLGTSLAVTVPFIYIFSTHIWHIYIAQLIYGFGAAFSWPAWASVFYSHIEKGRRGLQWSLYNSTIGIGTAITAWIGAEVAQAIGFQVVFAIAGAAGVVGLLVLLRLDRKRILKKI